MVKLNIYSIIEEAKVKTVVNFLDRKGDAYESVVKLWKKGGLPAFAKVHRFIANILDNVSYQAINCLH